jgi:hypothetical protein
MTLPKYLTTVTTFSKILAMILFILLPILGFKLGMDYQKGLDNLPKNENLLVTAPSNIIISPTPSVNIQDKIMAQYDTKEKISKDLDENLLSGKYTAIPNTDLEIKIPSTYVFQERKLESNNVVGHVLFYGKKISQSPTDTTFYYQRIPNFFIGTVSTSLIPKQWLAENVSYQGQKWDESMGTGKEININNINLFSVGVACCGGYNQLYIYPYKSLTGQNIFVVFGTYDIFADNDYNTENWTKGIKTDRNIILDNVVFTLQKK